MTGASPLLEWFSRNPEAHFWLAAAILLAALAAAARPLLRATSEEAKGHDWTWGVVLLAILAAGRWPGLLTPRQFNVDEGQLLAGARVLTGDPVFWRAVNGGTAGPLDFFALWPAGWLFGWDSYFPARLTALALIAFSLALAHQCLALVLGRRIARIATLGAAAFEALTKAPDFLHFSTELVPVILLSAAAYAAVRRWVAAGGPAWCGLGGLSLGAVPFAKLQALPLAALMGLAWLGCEWRHREPDRGRLIVLLAGALAPAAFFAGQLTIAGEWRSFTNSYLLYNLHYAAKAAPDLRSPLVQFLDNSLSWDSLLHLWLPASIAWLALMLRARPMKDRPLRLFTWAVIVAWLVSLASVISPGRPFLHYWQLMVVPHVLLTGAAIAWLLAAAPPRWQAAERRLAAFGAAGVIALLLLHRMSHPDPWVGKLAGFQQQPHSPRIKRLAHHTRPGETVAIWGWTNDVYTEAGLRQATRDCHAGVALEPGPLQDYFRERWLADFQHAQPDLFIDSIGPASLHYADPALRHERYFPALAALIRADYTLVDETHELRLFRRKETAPR